MRYSATHKQETREKLLESSRAIAKQSGFEVTGVDALMSAVGLTGGAFYAHFDSKADLFAEMIEQEVANSAAMLGGDETSPPDHVSKCIRSYLSNYHALHPAEGCGLAALGPEIARAGPEVRTKVEGSLKKMQANWSERMEGNGDQAWSLLAQCIGTLVLARVVESEKTRREILAASRRSVEEQLARNGATSAKKLKAN